MGAGILPITIYDNKIYLLFGKEREIDKTPGWSDFAGGQDNNESQFETALREGTEELTGFLGSEKDLKKMLKKCGTYNVDWKTYRTHIFPMKYDELLPYYYNNNQRFLQKRLNPKIIEDSKIFEKEEIKWIPIDDLKKMRKKFRSFYQNIVDILYDDRENIKKFVRKYLNKNGEFKNKTYKNKRKLFNSNTRKNRK